MWPDVIVQVWFSVGSAGSAGRGQYVTGSALVKLGVTRVQFGSVVIQM